MKKKKNRHNFKFHYVVRVTRAAQTKYYANNLTRKPHRSYEEAKADIECMKMQNSLKDGESLRKTGKETIYKVWQYHKVPHFQTIVYLTKDFSAFR